MAVRNRSFLTVLPPVQLYCDALHTPIGAGGEGAGPVPDTVSTEGSGKLKTVPRTVAKPAVKFFASQLASDVQLTTTDSCTMTPYWWSLLF